MTVKNNDSKLMDQINDKVSYTLDILKAKVLENDYYDNTFFEKNMKTLKFKLFNNNYLLNHSNDNFKLSREKHQGKIIFRDKTEDEIRIPKGTVAYYHPVENKVYCSLDNLNTEILLHEIIHMSSTLGPGRIGFTRQIKGSTYMDRHMINEGMTQWLTQKTLNGNDENNRVYAWQTRIARLLCLAIGDEMVFSYFSKANFKEISKLVKTSKEKYPLRKIAELMEGIHTINNYVYALNNQALPANILYSEAINVYASLYYLLKKIQRIIIDLFVENEENINNQDKVIEFYDTLITQDVSSDYIYEFFAPILEGNFDASNYLVKQIKKNNKDMYNNTFTRTQK